MPKLLDNECYRRIKTVDVRHPISVLDRVSFIDSGNECAVVSDPKIPLQRQFWMTQQRCQLGGQCGRMFVRKLTARMGIPPHVDDWIKPELNLRRFHIPLITHPDIIMRWPDDDQEVHLEAGWLWEVRVDRMHEVVHNADIDRIHIQIDQLNATI